MINSKADYKVWYIADCKATGIYHSRYSLLMRIKEKRYKFYKLLRKTEYYTNCRKDKIGVLYAKWLRLRYGLLCDKYMWQIPINVCGKGLQLVHRGPIIISGYATIGEYARIHVGVNIGNAPSHGIDGAPQIGNYCYMGPGVKMFGPIKLGDNIAIGANAVVNKSFPEGNCTLGGVPAKIISQKTSKEYISENAE